MPILACTLILVACSGSSSTDADLIESGTYLRTGDEVYSCRENSANCSGTLYSAKKVDSLILLDDLHVRMVSVVDGEIIRTVSGDYEQNDASLYLKNLEINSKQLIKVDSSGLTFSSSFDKTAVVEWKYKVYSVDTIAHCIEIAWNISPDEGADVLKYCSPIK